MINFGEMISLAQKQLLPYWFLFSSSVNDCYYKNRSFIKQNLQHNQQKQMDFVIDSKQVFFHGRFNFLICMFCMFIAYKFFLDLNSHSFIWLEDLKTFYVFPIVIINTVRKIKFNITLKNV